MHGKAIKTSYGRQAKHLELNQFFYCHYSYINSQLKIDTNCTKPNIPPDARSKYPSINLPPGCLVMWFNLSYEGYFRIYGS
jgi:hypothetical protein